ncbi:MAG TPA: hypothetical protein ENJ35_05845, partial [Gammaproteobacteria bacterium]|nr:hypothetical protein [Gammaproteobacteria bacterium]
MNTSSPLPFAIVINGEKVVEHDRNKRLTGIQRRFLDEMDQKMDSEGIEMGNEKFDSPNAVQKAQYIANTLINALQNENESLAAACSSYLARRLPDLQQVKAKSEKNGATMIELVFDRSYEKASTE